MKSKIKVDGKAGKLTDKVDVTNSGTKLTIESSTPKPFAKRYFKYLAKKYLHKQQLRNYLRVVACAQTKNGKAKTGGGYGACGRRRQGGCGAEMARRPPALSDPSFPASLSIISRPTHPRPHLQSSATSRCRTPPRPTHKRARCRQACCLICPT